MRRWFFLVGEVFLYLCIFKDKNAPYFIIDSGVGLVTLAIAKRCVSRGFVKHTSKVVGIGES